MTALIHLRAPGGAVIGFTGPLHETIAEQWARGELERVHADGSPWQDDEGLPGEPGDDISESAPVRPRGNAHVSKWQAYAVAIGACTPDEAQGMTRAELIGLATPPEEKPPDPEG